MENKFTSTSEILINAPAPEVWDALVNPEKIKQYLFGTNAVSDWKAGSPIFYRGEWEGKTYEDKGIILELVPEKLLVNTYWSSMGGLADLPENYQKITYSLDEKEGQTNLTLTQENSISQQNVDHSGENWKMVLGKLKEIVEK